MTLAAPARFPDARGAGRSHAAPEPGLIEPLSLAAASMGGRLTVHIDAADRPLEASRDGRRVIARIDRWASRLTRHTDTSDLAVLNSDPQQAVGIRPTLAAALVAGMLAAQTSEGFADITLLCGPRELPAPPRRPASPSGSCCAGHAAPPSSAALPVCASTWAAWGRA